MDVWSWICELPESEEWSSGETTLSYEIATRGNESIQLRAERTVFESDPESTSLSFSLHFHSSSGDEQETVNLWDSDKCFPLRDQPFMPLIIQLLQEIITRAPDAQDTSACPRSQLQSIKPDPISWILETHSQESFSTFFNLVFLTRMFWMCVFDAPSEVGSLYFSSLLTPNLRTFSCKHAPVLRTFFVSAGTDVELCFTRTFGYMLAKSVLFRQMGMGPATVARVSNNNDPLGLTYGLEFPGMWILKGYIPVNSMECVFSNRRSINQFQYYPLMIEPKESVLKYALAHQQLEGVIQMEYNVVFHEGFIQVQAKVDNIRLNVVKLGFKNQQDGLGDADDVLRNEKHFPSRVRVWVGPEVGANYVGCVSLGRSTDNSEREVAMEKTMKGSFGKMDIPVVKGLARVATRTTVKNWRWDQDVEGNAVVFDGTLCDASTGAEVATWRPPVGEESQLAVVNSFAKRYSGGNRAFTKSGGVVFSGEEFGGDDGGVRWRLSKDMEGSVLKWKIGVQVWLSYWPNEVTSSFCETRNVEWCDEVDLPLIPGKHT